MRCSCLHNALHISRCNTQPPQTSDESCLDLAVRHQVSRAALVPQR